MKRNPFRLNFSCFIFLTLMTSCTVGPRYEEPNMVIEENWHTLKTDGMTECDPNGFLWWKALNDPILDSLIQMASQQNIDLFIAGTRILEARLERKGKEGEYYPHIDGSVTAGHLYWSKDALINGILGHACDRGKYARKRNINFFEIGFDADWEIDLFGFNKHEVKAAEARLESMDADLCDVWITLSAEIARNYVELRGLQQRLLIMNRNLNALQESFDLTKQLVKIGSASAIDLLKAEEAFILLNVQMPTLDLSVAKAIHRLSILVGRSHEELVPELSTPQKIPLLPNEKPIGLPSDLLRRRPDIRKAERNLAAATESVGSAVAALFPRFSLYGFIGEIGTQFKSLAKSSGASWFAAPQLLFPIFNSRLLTQDIELNKIRARQSLFEYQKSVLSALEEVENAMVAFRSEMERNEYFNRIRQIKEEAMQLTQQLFDRGVVDYLEVLKEKNALLLAEDARLESEIALLLNYISLYKALGGGWELPADS